MWVLGTKPEGSVRAARTLVFDTHVGEESSTHRGNYSQKNNKSEAKISLNIYFTWHSWSTRL